MLVPKAGLLRFQLALLLDHRSRVERHWAGHRGKWWVWERSQLGIKKGRVAGQVDAELIGNKG